LIVTGNAVWKVNKHIPKARFEIERGIREVNVTGNIPLTLSQSNHVLIFFIISLITRFLLSISVIFYNWFVSKYVVIIYPFYYFIVEWWPIIFMLYKLIFSKHNFSLNTRTSPLLTYPGIDVSKTNVFFGKRGHTLYALKYTTISEVKVLQRLRMKVRKIVTINSKFF
jgi:hypothetical protein